MLSVDVTPSKVETQLLGSGLYWIALVQPVDGAPISATVRATTLLAPVEAEVFVDQQEQAEIGATEGTGGESSAVSVTMSVERREKLHWLGANSDTLQEQSTITLFEVFVPPIVNPTARDMQRSALSLSFS